MADVVIYVPVEGGGAVDGGGRVQGVTYTAHSQIPQPLQVVGILRKEVKSIFLVQTHPYL